MKILVWAGCVSVVDKDRLGAGNDGVYMSSPRVCVCVCRTVYQIVTDRIVQTPPSRAAHLLPLSVAGRPETNVDFTVSQWWMSAANSLS